VFSQNDDDGVVEILVSEPGPEQLNAVRTAVHGCPTSAITLEEG
jgi:ferredoxin